MPITVASWSTSITVSIACGWNAASRYWRTLLVRDRWMKGQAARSRSRIGARALASGWSARQTRWKSSAQNSLRLQLGRLGAHRGEREVGLHRHAPARCTAPRARRRPRPRCRDGAARKRASTAGSQPAASEGRSASETRPRRSAARSCMPATALSNSASTRRAGPSKSAPSTVGATWRLLRSKRRTPRRLLERADQGAERRLRQVHRRRGAGEVALLQEQRRRREAGGGWRPFICFSDHLIRTFDFTDDSVRPRVAPMHPTPGPSRPRRLRIGCAAGFSGDRTDAAGPVVEALIAAGGPAVPDLRDARRAHAGAGAAARRADPEAGYEPLLDELLRPVLARCLAHGIRIVSNFGAANPRGAARRIAALAARARPARRRGSRWSRATTSARPGSGRCCARRWATPGVDGVLRRWSAPTPTSAPSRSPMRCSPARRSSSPAASPTRRSPSARRWPTSAGGATTGTGWRAPPWPATCSNAARRSAAATTPTRATRTSPTSPTSATRSPRSMPTATARSPSPPARGGRIDAHTVNEQLLYEVHDPGGLPHARRRRRHQRGRASSSSAPTACASTACAAIRGRRRSRSTSSASRAGWPKARSPTPARAPRRGPGSRPRCCAAAAIARAGCAST